MISYLLSAPFPMISPSDLCACNWADVFIPVFILGPAVAKVTPELCKVLGWLLCFSHRHHLSDGHWTGLSQWCFILKTLPIPGFSWLFRNRLSRVCQCRAPRMTFLYCLLLEQLSHGGNRRTLNSNWGSRAWFYFFKEVINAGGILSLCVQTGFS